MSKNWKMLLKKFHMSQDPLRFIEQMWVEMGSTLNFSLPDFPPRTGRQDFSNFAVSWGAFALDVT